MRPGSDRLGDHGKPDEHSAAATARVLEPGVTEQARDEARMPTWLARQLPPTAFFRLVWLTSSQRRGCWDEEPGWVGWSESVLLFSALLTREVHEFSESSAGSFSGLRFLGGFGRVILIVGPGFPSEVSRISCEAVHQIVPRALHTHLCSSLQFGAASV